MIYTCQQCGNKVKVVRFDLNEPIPKGETVHKQVCDKCYFSKDKPKKE